MERLIVLRNWSSVLALVAVLAVPGIAPAQEEEAQAEEARKPPAIEEIVVTARYREERVQDTPIAITAFTETTLEKITAQDLRDVGPMTPNLHIQPVVTFPNSAAVHVRGMGAQNIESTNEQRSGISIDGVFISRPIATLIDLFDVERIEVLRGPQGTSFGKNSLAGGLNITTIRPDGTFGAKAEVTIGNEGRKDFRGAVQFPIFGETLYARVSGISQSYDGHFRNRVDGSDLNGEGIKALRGTLVWEPTDNLDVTLIGTWLRERSDAPGGDNAPDPGQILTFFGYTEEPRDGPYTVGRDSLDFHDTDQWGVTAIINWDINEYFTLTSITGVVETDDFIASDFDQTEILFFPTFRDQVHDQFSQELRLQSNFSGRTDFLADLDVVLGLYYFRQEHELVQSFPTLPFPVGSSADYSWQQGDSRAIFGQLIYALDDRLNLSFGARFTKEHKDYDRNPGLNFPPGAIAPYDDATRPSIGFMGGIGQSIFGHLRDDQTTVKVGIDYRWSDDVLAYVSFSQGYKAGEFGARAASNFTVGPTSNEESDSYEIGIKSDWLEDRLRLNVTAFYTQYENLQFGVFFPAPDNPTGQETANQSIGEATIQGIEVELTAVPLEGLTIQASLGLLDAEFDEFCADLDGPGPEAPSNCGGNIVELPDGTFLVDVDHTDLDLSRAPDTQVYVSAEYVYPIRYGSLFARAAGNYEADYFSDSNLNHPKGETGDFWLWDASLGWQSEESWRVSFWCKNCFDRNEISGLTPTANFFNQRFWNLPRMYGVTVSWRY